MPDVSWFAQSVIYQIFTGRWEERTDSEGLAQTSLFQRFIKQNWQCLLDLGINTFYFLGLFDNSGPILVQEEHGLPLSSGKYKRVPSIFAIHNHKAFNADFGSKEEFIELVGYLHSLKARVIVDFVPNHTSTSHPWIKDHPEYYVHHDGHFVAEFSGDVYKLDYSNLSLRQEMLEVLLWIAALGVDGVRCDMVHLVPTDFWQWAIKQVKQQYPEVVFVAEAYPNSIFDYENIKAIYSAGFDACYHYGLYTNLQKVIVENAPVEYLVESLKSANQNQPGLKVNYYFNHDDPPLINHAFHPDIEKLTLDYFECLLGLILFVPDLPFIYNGSLLGHNQRLAHHWLEPLAYSYLETCQTLPAHVSSLFKLRQTLCPSSSIENVTTNQQILYFQRQNLFFAFNLSRQPQRLSLGVNITGKVHQLKQNDMLQPGSLEVWVTE